MKITSVRIKANTLNSNKSLLGVASIEFDNCFVVRDLQLVQLSDKRVVCFPNKKVKKYVVSEDGYNQNFEYTDIAHPSNKEFRQYIESELFKIYDAEIANKGRLNNE